ncbi:MAG: hypothetical protein RMK45_09620 [Armatimonadota bacterium]|nr:hypothetical protein [Armatimonadota bacterium]
MPTTRLATHKGHLLHQSGFQALQHSAWLKPFLQDGTDRHQVQPA